MYISHILYRVHDFETSVARLLEAGFKVDIAKDGDKPYHAIIWFRQGPYLEIIKPEDYPAIDPELLKIEGNIYFQEWVNNWKTKDQRWCDFAIETEAIHLDHESEILKNHNIRFKMHEVLMEFPQGLQGWQSIVTEDRAFPFLVSSYRMDPRPYKPMDHPNGVQAVEQVLIGTEGLNLDLFDELMSDSNYYSLVPGKGVLTVTLKDSELKFENLL